VDAAGVVFSKAPHIIDGFSKGTTIRAKGRKFLAIPTQFAPKMAGREQMTPANFERKTGIQLHFVDRKGKNPLLVTRGTRLTKGGRVRKLTTRKATKTMGPRTNLKGQAWVPMFTLVPQVKLRKRLDVAREIPKAQSLFVSEVERVMNTK
jgi:hypothetical protein